MRKLSSALLLLFVVLAIQSYAKAPGIPALAVQAKYVALGFETADGFIGESDLEAVTSSKVLPADRQALANVRDALAKWNRYVITIIPHQADILIAVRTGRRASAFGGVHVGSGPIDPTTGRRTGGPEIGPTIGAEVGPANDYLAVYQSDGGREAARLWVQSEEDGLEGKNPQLFQNFKNAVESAARKQSKKP